MRPPGPVPVMAAGSRLFSLTSRRTTGESSFGPAPSAGAGASVAPLPLDAGAGASSAAGAGGRRRSGGRSLGLLGRGLLGLGRRRRASGAGASAAGASSAGASADGAVAVARRRRRPPGPAPRPTSTVSPSGTRISDTTPATGDGTSESTLSVETSNSGSSSATWSPTSLNHLVIVPSVTVSPSWGIWMSAMAWCLALDRLDLGVVEGGAAAQWSRRPVRSCTVSPNSSDSVGWGWMNCADLVDRRLPVDGQVALAQLLGDPRADHVDAEDRARGAVGVLLGDDLHQALLVADDLGPAVGAVAVLGGDDVVAGLLGVGLGVAGEGHLGPAVDAPRHLAVVDRHALLAEDALDGEHPLGEADVGELRRGDAVADGPHAVLGGRHVLVDLHEAALVERDRGAVEQALGVGPAADRDDDDVGLDGVGALDAAPRCRCRRAGARSP